MVYNRRRSLGGRVPSTSSFETRQERVPYFMQSIFLRSNRGQEVNKPPPQQLAQKTFTSSWFFGKSRRTSITGSSSSSLADAKNVDVPPIATVSIPVSISTTPTKKQEPLELSLQEYFDALLEERGYYRQLFNTLETAYYNTATEFQMASYGPRMVQIVKSRDATALREVMLGGGLSPNPCNKFGESLLHMVCRRNDVTLLKIMVEAGAVLEVCDDYGRTPLHDACWAANPAFEVVTILLQHDPTMFFMKDKRGSLPLSYVHKSDWKLWREWLDQNIDLYFPASKATTFAFNKRCSMKPNSVPLSEYPSDLSLELIRMVANGDITLSEAYLVGQRMNQKASEKKEEEEEVEDMDTTCDDSDYDDSEYDSEDYSDDDEDDDDDEDLMEHDDMIEMLQFALSRQGYA